MVATIIVLAAILVVLIVLMTDRQSEPLRNSAGVFIPGLSEFLNPQRNDIDRHLLNTFGPQECYHHAFTPYAFGHSHGTTEIQLEFVCESCGAELHICGEVVGLPPNPANVITFKGTATVSGAKDGLEPVEPREDAS